jgi:hypothetical protein
MIWNNQSHVFVLSNNFSKEADMKSTIIALAVASVVLGPTPSTFAADAKVAKGTITAISGQSLTIKVGEQDMAFNVDSATTVWARGASTKSARLAAAGKPGPHLADVLKTGQAVAVTYRDTAGNYRASEITAIPKVPEPDANAAKHSAGIVKAIGPDWLTISGSGGGKATFEQTFKIEPHTMVWVKGATKAVAAKDGKAPFGNLVGSGDHVNVAYRAAGDALVASELHVTVKAPH